MNIFQEQAIRFKKIDINKITKSILKELDNVIVDMNTSQLKDKGEDSESKKLPLPYAPMTIEYKKLKGQPTDRITLYDEGDFQNAFYVKYTNEDFSLWSTDGKTEKLVKEWGENIFGLTDNNLTELIQKDLLPALQTELNKLL